MAIPFNIPPDEYSLRRLNELIEELYAILYVRLMNQSPPKPSPDEQRRRAPSCQDDEKNGQQNVGRDGGDSDSDPDTCAAPTVTSDGSAMAEIAAEIDLVQAEQRRHPNELLSPMKRLPESAEDRPPNAVSIPRESAVSPCRCTCQSQVPGSSAESASGRSQLRIADPIQVEPPVPVEDASTPRSNSLESLMSLIRNQVLGGILWAAAAFFVGYRLFCVDR